MIVVQALAKQFVQGRGRQRRVVDAVQGVSFEAADGCITGLLGPNGAGKTTTLRMIAGLVRPDAGQITVAGIDVARQPQAVQAAVVDDVLARRQPRVQAARVRQHAQLGLHGLGAAAADSRATLLARMLDMASLMDRRTDGFSQGERMKTALARALVHDPSHIILDEPTNGLDVLATRSLRDALRRLRDETGKCIVFSSHIMQEVERLCDQVVVVAGGRTVAEGTVPALLARTGHRDFEASFVQLAFGPAAAAGFGASP